MWEVWIAGSLLMIMQVTDQNSHQPEKIVEGGALGMSV